MSESGVSTGTVSSDGHVSETISSSNAPGEQRSQGTQPDAAPVEWSAERKEAYSKMAEIREAHGKATSQDEKDRLWRQLNETHGYVFLGRARPNFLTPTDAEPDLRPYSSERAAWEEANDAKSMTDADAEYLERHSKVMGMPPDAAQAFSRVVRDMRLDATSGKSLLNAIAPHVQAGVISGAGFQQMPEADFASKAEIAIREAGGLDRLREYSIGAREFLATYPELNRALDAQGAFKQSAASLDVSLLIRLHGLNERRKARGR